MPAERERRFSIMNAAVSIGRSTALINKWTENIRQFWAWDKNNNINWASVMCESYTESKLIADAVQTLFTFHALQHVRFILQMSLFILTFSLAQMCLENWNFNWYLLVDFSALIIFSSPSFIMSFIMANFRLFNRVAHFSCRSEKLM